jgi:hypothetical protein
VQIVVVIKARSEIWEFTKLVSKQLKIRPLSGDLVE